ncbi:MAG: GTPase [Thermoanaerobaculia bacterium]|nr:GTPase [Thermoanaerobaculia bacterium]
MSRPEPHDAAAGKRRVVILGAAGRDFHNFNVVYRDDPDVEVVAFTATQIPGIEGRRYPSELAGPAYPEGIPIEDEADLEELCRTGVDEVVFAYSDVTHEHVMHLASRALAAGSDFSLLGPRRTMLRAQVPVVAVCAVRTGCGKSQVTRWLARRLANDGKRLAVIRHPMPYGDLAEQAVQRFATVADLDAESCSLEEREEYEPHIAAGNVVFAGVDFARILERAQTEADLILWDGGNNDFPFLRPDVLVVLADPLRAGHETTHHPGEATLRMADVVVIAKTDAAAPEQVEAIQAAVAAANPTAATVRGRSPVRLDDPSAVAGRRVLVVEDGPTITHGSMPSGAGLVAAREAGAAEIVDPRASATEAIRAVYEAYAHIGPVLPAVGYGGDQLAALRDTIAASRAEVVVNGSPVDLAAILDLPQPVVRARYEYEEAEEPGLWAEVEARLERLDRAGSPPAVPGPR